MTRWVAFVSVCVGVDASQRILLSVLARNPHKGLLREISDETAREGGKEGRRENRRNQSTDQSSYQERTVDRSRGKPTVKRRKVTGRTCGLRGRVGQRERMSQRSWWLCGGFARIHARANPQMHRKLRKTNFSLLSLGANPSPCLFVIFSSALSVVYVVFCVSIKKCEIPLAGDERNHRTI